jgi:SprB repeat
MKKAMIVLSLVLLSSIPWLLSSCRHELPLSCSDVNFKIETSKTDAVLNNANGTISVKASGGSGFQYSLNGGSLKDSGYFEGLEPFKEYRIVGRNSLGCTDTSLISIGSFDPCSGVTVALTATKIDADPNQTNGSIAVVATGGTGYTYSINGGTFQASGNFANLAAGKYTVAAKSDAGCLGTTDVTIASKDLCAGITVAVTSTQTNPGVGLTNGSITAAATGGTGFTFSLNNGAYQASGTFANLAAGTYTITAKNSNGCMGSKQISLAGTDPCAGITVAITTIQTDPAAGQSNGSITATATGGTGFTYSINSGAFQTSGTFTGLITGNYTITAKNATGCTGSIVVALGSTNPCAGITVAVTSTQVNPVLNQSNGSITAAATGGTGFTYSLNNGAYQAGAVFGNLAAGTYTITAKNANGCLGTKQVTLTSTDPCAGITVAVTTVLVNPTTGLSNGSITASATGGTGFTYSLNNGTFQTSGVFGSLGAGSYTVTAKNANGCLGSAVVTLTAASACTNVNITMTFAIVSVTPCLTPANNGGITVTAAGSSGYTYNINGGAYQASAVFASLNAGNYLIGVKDGNGCSNTQTATVGVVPQGTTFAPLRALISAHCSGTGCHMNGGKAAGYNFDTDCSIVGYWSQINGACVTGALKKMPISPQPALTTAEKLVITTWINAGHRYTD